MNWIKENKFLFGFLVVMLVGVGVGAYFLLGAKSRYDEAYEDYQKRVGELNRLQRLPTYPNKENLEKLAGQKKQVDDEVSALAASLAAQQLPTEDLSPEQFQDRLKAAATAIKAKAQGSPAVKLPGDKFFLGFERYETAPPAKEAAAALGRELKAIEWLCNQLIEVKVAEIKSLSRDELPEEKGRVKADEKKKSGAPASAKAAPGKPDKSDKGAVKHEVEKHRIELAFISDQARFRKLLNTIVEYKGQFFIPRLVNVKNEKVTAPARAVAAAEAVPSADGAAANPGTPAPVAAPSTYIVGEEKIEVILVLEMVDFSEVGTK
jgi:hypothetical protein